MPTPPGLPPRPLRDRRNRSYRNQDLTGADFSYTDLRGCDFTGATLVGANFQGCRTGQSRRQIITRIAVAGAGAVAGAVAAVGAAAGAVAGAVAVAFVVAVAVAGAFIGTFAGTFADAFAVTVASAFAVATTGTTITAFSQGRILEGIGHSFGAVIFTGFAIYSFLDLVKTLRNATGTTFKGADLSRANFTDSVVQNADFSDSVSHLIQWNNEV